MVSSAQEDLLDAAHARILREVRADPRAPAIVLCPHAAVAHVFQQRLAREVPAESLPRVTTLPGWAAEQPLAGRVVPEIERLSLIFNALRERRWFEHQDRWVLAQEALRVVDELTHWGVVMPRDPEAFVTRLGEAYAARQGGLLHLEARLIHELWWVLSQNPLELSPPMAYQQRLAALADGSPAGTCYLVAPGVLTPAETRSLEQLGQRLRLVRFEAALPGRADDPCTPVLRAAWQEPVTESLEARAQAQTQAFPDSPLATRVGVCGHETIEREAQEGARQIRHWLSEGRRTIAIVAQDRVSSRRLRAMLERQGIAVRDESGWTFSTTAATTVVMRWLDLVRSGGHYRHLLDLLHSPYLCSDWPAPGREAGIQALEKHLLRVNWTSGLDALAQGLSEREPGAGEGLALARELVARLVRARDLFLEGPQSFAEWLARLRRTLEMCGMETGLAGDAAGQQLLSLLESLSADAREAPGLLPLGDWVRVLELQFEAATFQDDNPEAAVCMTQLSMTRLRAFDAVLLVGADAGHLPFIPAPAYFGDAVRLSLGLPVRQDLLQACRDDLVELVSRAGVVRVSWRSAINGERNALAPLMQRLNLFHQKAWGTSLLAPPTAPAESALPPRPQRRPAPTLSSGQVPQVMTASGHNRLLACPYQFFVSDVLGLGEATGIRETVDKRDYGQLIHEALLRFHRANPGLSDLSRSQAMARLETSTVEAFERLAIPDEEARAWLLRWQACIPAYVAWAQAREQEGWRWEQGEILRERLLGAHTPGQVRLKGKLDRLDRRQPGQSEALSILDYKLKSYQGRMRREMSEGEDVQLAFYCLLTDGLVTQAAYLLLDDGPPREVESPDPEGIAEAVSARLLAIMAALREGAALPAHGEDQDCRYCRFGGLCRKDHWEANP